MIPFLSPGLQASPEGATPFGPSSLPPTASPGAGLLARLGLNPEMIAALQQRLQGIQPGGPASLDMLREQLMSNPEIKAKLLAIARPQNPNVQEMPMPPMGQGPQPNAAAGWADGLNRGMQKRVAAGKELPRGIQKRQPGAGSVAPKPPESGPIMADGQMPKIALPNVGIQAGPSPSPTGVMTSVTPDQGLNTGGGPMLPGGDYRRNRLMGRYP